MSTTTAAPPPIVATPAQARYLEALLSGRYRFLAYGGAIRGGKTFTLLLAVFLLCKIFPGSRWAIVRKDLPTLRRNILPAFNKVRPVGFCSAVNQSDWTARCTNGSEILFFTESLDIDPDLDRWKGLEVNGFVLEEANELAEKSFHKAQERAGAWVIPGVGAVQPPPLILLSFNPAANWVRHVFYEPSKRDALAAPYYFQRATIEDNPHLTADYRESLTHLPEQEYKRFVLGDWDAVGGRYFDALDARTHLVDRKALPETLPAWWAMWSSYDWGFRHLAAGLFYAQDGDGNQYVLDTVLSHRLSDREQAERMRDAATACGAQRALSCCYSGSDTFNKAQAHGYALPVSVADTFGLAGIGCVPAYTERVGGWRQLRQALQPTPATETTAALPPRLRFIDTPNNRRLLDTLLALEPDPTKPEDVQKVDADDQGRGGDDAADSLRYGIATRAFSDTPPDRAEHPWLGNQDPGDLLADLYTDPSEDGRHWGDLPAGY